MKLNRILFPTDFAELSLRAREYVVSLAKHYGASVYILHAIEPVELYEEEVDEEIEKFYDDIKRDVESKIEREREYFQKLGIEALSSVIVGKRWSTINSFARDNEIDLVVVGSHSIRTKEGKISIGTTSHKVAMSSPCPVLIVRRDED